MRLVGIILVIVAVAGLVFILQPRNVGLMFEHGIIVGRDKDEARKWYLKALNDGDIDAEYVLAETYYVPMYGPGQPPAEATEALLRWKFDAAERGQAQAQADLAKGYAWGISGMSVDYEQAYFWAALALRNNTDDVALGDIPQYMLAHLPPEKAEAVKKRVAEWKPRTGPVPPEGPPAVKLPATNREDKPAKGKK